MKHMTVKARTTLSRRTDAKKENPNIFLHPSVRPSVFGTSAKYSICIIFEENKCINKSLEKYSISALLII